MKEEIKNAIEVLRKGGVILYPTDTIWGIGCDATNEKAVEKIYKIKQREEGKGMLVLVDSPDRILSYVNEVPSMAWSLIDVAENPLTIIYPDAVNLANNLLPDDKSIGIRVTQDEFCKELIRQFRKPIVSTSANFSGEKFPENFDEISQEIIDTVNYVVDWRQDDISNIQPSSVIKLGLGGEVEVIRK